MKVWILSHGWYPGEEGIEGIYLSEGKAKADAVALAMRTVGDEYQGELEWVDNRLVPKKPKGAFPSTWIGVEAHEVIE
jgi:hypothetical protein